MAAVNERLESSSEEEIDCCYSSSNESFEGEEGACGYTCEPEYSKDELIKLGIDVLEEKSVRTIAMVVMNLIQVDVKIYIALVYMHSPLYYANPHRRYRFILLQENRRLLR